jgi:hypothetical protein
MDLIARQFSELCVLSNVYAILQHSQQVYEALTVLVDPKNHERCGKTGPLTAVPLRVSNRVTPST